MWISFLEQGPHNYSQELMFANLSVIREKDESQIGGNKKTKHTNFSGKMNISYPLIHTRN